MSDAGRSVLEDIHRRTGLINKLAAGPADKPELTERLDISRTTVDRAIRELESAGLVERTDEGYVLTLFGRLVHEEFDRFLERLASLRRARDLLEHLPSNFEIDPEVLAGATVMPSNQPMPHEPIEHFETAVEESDHVVGYSPVVFPEYISLFHREITEEGTTAELFLDETLVGQLRTNYAEELQEVTASEGCRLYQFPPEHASPVGIVLLDDTTVWIGVYDGDLQGMIVVSSLQAREWARERFDRYRDHAVELSADAE